MADRFYCPEPPVDGRIALEGDEARHLGMVLRAEPGRVVEVFDGRGHAHRAEVLSVDKRRVWLSIVAPLPPRPLPCRLVLGVAPPKGDRLDWLVEKATELGVSTLVPLRTARSVVDPRPAKVDRLRRAVVEATKQCGRDTLMEVAEPMAWADWLGLGPGLIAVPGGLDVSAWPCFEADATIRLAIGPEGGFTAVELERAAGWTAVNLGPTTLRIETAAMAGAAIVVALASGRTSGRAM